MWSVQITDMNSAVKALLFPHEMVLTRRLNSYSTLDMKVHSLDPSASELLIAERAIKLYKDGVLRFYGKISEPLLDTEDWIQVTAQDPFFFLMRRRLQADVTFSATDAGSIAWSLIDTQNARGSTRIQTGTVNTSVNRDRTYLKGQVVGELITNLANVNNGFYFWVDPVDAVSGVFGAFQVRYPTPGSAVPNGVFEYGDGTLGNLTGYTRTLQLPTNSSRATGIIVGDVVMDSVQSDSTSISTYDILDGEVDYPEVSEQSTLDQHALGDLQPNPITTYQVQVAPTDGTQQLFVPQLFTDFDTGDTVRLRIKHGRLDVSVTPLVTQAGVIISDDGDSEKLENLYLQTGV